MKNGLKVGGPSGLNNHDGGPDGVFTYDSKGGPDGYPGLSEE